jgi:hypothetical protein
MEVGLTGLLGKSNVGGKRLGEVGVQEFRKGMAVGLNAPAWRLLLGK